MPNFLIFPLLFSLTFLKPQLAEQNSNVFCPNIAFKNEVKYMCFEKESTLQLTISNHEKFELIIHSLANSLKYYSYGKVISKLDSTILVPNSKISSSKKFKNFIFVSLDSINM